MVLAPVTSTVIALWEFSVTSAYVNMVFRHKRGIHSLSSIVGESLFLSPECPLTTMTRRSSVLLSPKQIEQPQIRCYICNRRRYVASKYQNMITWTMKKRKLHKAVEMWHKILTAYRNRHARCKSSSSIKHKNQCAALRSGVFELATNNISVSKQLGTAVSAKQAVARRSTVVASRIAKVSEEARR